MARVKRGVVARAKHKKVLKKEKVITVRVVAFIVLPNRQSSRLANMHIVTVVKRSVSFVHYGLSVLMRQHVSVACLTAV